MKISAGWILSQLPWLETVSKEELESRMAILGHRVDISSEVWEFIPRPQRSDLCGVNNILREMAAAFGKSFELPLPHVWDEDIGSVYEQLDADVWNDTLCNRFTVKMAVTLKAGMTPDWMKERLLAAGLSVTDSVADIAKYVCLEYGQPVLLLDAKAICDGTMSLREAYGYETAADLLIPYGVPILESGEQFLAVPGFWVAPEYEVGDKAESIVIAAVNYPQEVTSLCEETFCVLYACLDPLLTITAVERTCQLIQELGCGQVLDGCIDILNFVPNPKKLDLQAAYPWDIPLTEDEFNTILAIIGITGDGLIPSWRPDLDSPEAVTQEVTRIHRANTLIKD